jgi:hypothetical protein
MAAKYLRSFSQIFESRSDDSSGSLLKESDGTDSISHEDVDPNQVLEPPQAVNKKVTRKFTKATKSRRFMLQIGDQGLSGPLNNRTLLTPRIISYGGKKGKDDYYEVVWHPITMTLRDYRRGMHNYREADRPTLINDGANGWMVHLTWSPCFVNAVLIHPSIIEAYHAAEKAAIIEDALTAQSSYIDSTCHSDTESVISQDGSDWSGPVYIN